MHEPDGTGIMFVGGGESHSDWLRCCHCGHMHLVAAALRDLIQGKPVLGFCAKCDHPCCPECSECVPNERQIENMEAGRPVLTPSPAFAAFERNPLILPGG